MAEIQKVSIDPEGLSFLCKCCENCWGIHSIEIGDVIVDPNQHVLKCPGCGHDDFEVYWVS